MREWTKVRGRERTPYRRTSIDRLVPSIANALAGGVQLQQAPHLQPPSTYSRGHAFGDAHKRQWREGKGRIECRAEESERGGHRAMDSGALPVLARK